MQKQNVPQCRNKKYHNVETKSTTMQKQKVPQCRNKTYHNVETNSTTIQKQKVPQCRNKKYHNVETLLKSNRKIVERGQLNALTHICMTNHSLFWLDAGTAMNNDGVKLV